MNILLPSVLASAAMINAAAEKPYHVYEIPAPSQPGVFRVRVGDEAAKLWAVEQIQSVSVYDNGGQRLGCEQLRFSRLGATKKSYPIEGQWGDSEKLERGAYGPLNFAWRFTFPQFAENESPSYLHFNWQSKASSPGEVRLVEIPPDKSSYRGPMGTHLMDGQSDPRNGRVNLYLPQPKAWASQAELLFTLSQRDLTIESPQIETLTKKPWTLMPAGGPGWIIFRANGNGPYQLQIGEALYGCSAGAITDDSLSYSDPDWPPELTIGPAIANAPHMGETQASWNKHLDELLADKARARWMKWGLSVALAFGLALYFALTSKR
jgi:hypothetical protein